MSIYSCALGWHLAGAFEAATGSQPVRYKVKPFGGAQGGEQAGEYLLSDFAVRPTPHRRLSKLVLAAAVSREVRDDCEQWLCGRVRTIGTTAFTDRPVSMKYRGLFDVHSRSEGKVNYLGPAGRWSLKEGCQWWMDDHSTR